MKRIRLIGVQCTTEEERKREGRIDTDADRQTDKLIEANRGNWEGWRQRKNKNRQT